MSTIPKDPLSQEKYVYGVSSDKKYVQIAMLLESDTSSTFTSSPNFYDYQVKVIGKYTGLYRVGNVLYNLPSLIFSSGGMITYP